MMQRAFTLLTLSAAVLAADAGPADAQWRSRGGRGTAVISVGVGNGVLSYGQPYYSGQQYYSSQPYYGNGYSGMQTNGLFGTIYGTPSYGSGQAFNQTYYSTPTYYGGQHSGYGGQTYYPHTQTQYYHPSQGGHVVPAGYYRR